jgi:MoxR-like ATPase
MNSFSKRFIEAMRSHFVNVDDFAYAIALAMVCRRNLIAWGPGGHAKSEGVQFALSLVQEKPLDDFVLSCGEGMTEERLFGGIDLRALEEEHIIQYHTERSFLVRRWAVLEEGLDMPDAAALSLRDTLSAKYLRNGNQVVPMQTEVVFLLTNREPKEKAGLDASYKALLERFPLQIRVAWDTYTSDEYLKLIDRVETRDGADSYLMSLADDLRQTRDLYSQVKLANFKPVLADLLESAGSIGEPVSPRCAIAAAELVRAAAALRGSAIVEAEDLLAARFLPALALIPDLYKQINKSMAGDQVERHITQFNQQLDALLSELSEASTVDVTNDVCNRLEALHATIATMNIGNVLAQRRELEIQSAA